MQEIKISVIVPVYNQEKYIKKCFDSIQNQTLREIEIICVNDGSTDESLHMLEQIQATDERVAIITQKNKGLGAARNVGMLAAKGKYLAFVDSDDFIERTILEKLYQKAESSCADVVLCNFQTYDEKTGETKVYRDDEFYKYLAQKQTFTAKEEPKILLSIGVWDRIYRREFVEQNGLKNPEGVIYEDALFSYQTLILAKRLAAVSNPLYFYRKNSGQAITDKEVYIDKYKFDFLKNGREIRKFLRTVDQEGRFLDVFERYLLTNALWHQSNIMQYRRFQIFFKKIRTLVTKRQLIRHLKDKEFSWKTKIYMLMLILETPLACYGLFFWKHIKRKREEFKV